MEGVSKGFPGGSEGFQGFHQYDPRQEMFANVGRCAESRIRGRRRRPDEQTPNIILNKEIQDASSNFHTSDVAIGAWGSRASRILPAAHLHASSLRFVYIVCDYLLFSDLVYSYLVFSCVPLSYLLLSPLLSSPLLFSPLLLSSLLSFISSLIFSLMTSSVVTFSTLLLSHLLSAFLPLSPLVRSSLILSSPLLSCHPWCSRL